MIFFPKGQNNISLFIFLTPPFQLSALNCQLSTLSPQLSALNCQLSTLLIPLFCSLYMPKSFKNAQMYHKLKDLLQNLNALKL